MFAIKTNVYTLKIDEIYVDYRLQHPGNNTHVSSIQCTAIVKLTVPTNTRGRQRLIYFFRSGHSLMGKCRMWNLAQN
jgi:hypothetical protein